MMGVHVIFYVVVVVAMKKCIASIATKQQIG